MDKTGKDTCKWRKRTLSFRYLAAVAAVAVEEAEAALSTAPVEPLKRTPRLEHIQDATHTTGIRILLLRPHHSRALCEYHTKLLFVVAT